MFKETESELQKTISQGSTELLFVTPRFIKISSHKVMSWFATTYRIWIWSTDPNQFQKEYFQYIWKSLPHASRGREISVKDYI